MVRMRTFSFEARSGPKMAARARARTTTVDRNVKSPPRRADQFDTVNSI